jgi:hypothetical protein
MTDIEIGPDRALTAAGRDIMNAAYSARMRGEATQLTRYGQVVAAIIPAGRGSLTERELSRRVTELLVQLRSTAYKPDAEVTDAEVLGLLVGRFLDYDALDILRMAESALTDANAHDVAGNLADIRDVLQAELDEPAIPGTLVREGHPGDINDPERYPEG